MGQIITGFLRTAGTALALSALVLAGAVAASLRREERTGKEPPPNRE